MNRILVQISSSLLRMGSILSPVLLAQHKCQKHRRPNRTHSQGRATVLKRMRFAVYKYMHRYTKGPTKNSRVSVLGMLRKLDEENVPSGERPTSSDIIVNAQGLSEIGSQWDSAALSDLDISCW